MKIGNVCVIGSGVMGAGIAGHFANAGYSVILMDIVPFELSEDEKKKGLTQDSPAFRNRLATNALQNVLPKLKPSPIYDNSVLKRIVAGNLEDDLNRLRECDWVIEVVVERLDIKQNLFAKIEPYLKPEAIISSNTSGIPLHMLTEGRSENFKKNFLITHFFNPVRYMKLVEIISGPATQKNIVSFVADFLENELGKGVVYAKDTPNFVANRVGVFSMMSTLWHTIQTGLSIEAVDKITGPALAKAKSATFRTADIVGLDTLLHVAKNTADVPTDEARDIFKIPDVVTQIVANKWLGDKTGQGFYKKVKDESGKTILSLDLKTGEYKPQEKVRYESLGLAKNIECPRERVKTLVNAPDDAGRFAWLVTRDTIVYAMNRIPEIADDVVNIDRGMRWGFNAELGPFEVLDAIGVKEFAERLSADHIPAPQFLTELLANGTTVYKSESGVNSYFDIVSRSYKPVPTSKTHLVIKTLKETGHVLKSNDGASLIDLGDGVLNVEFHTKMNAIDGDIGQMMQVALDKIESDNQYKGLVISNDAQNFSVGANLMLLWMESQQQNWSGIEKLVKNFQDVIMRLRYSQKPVVVAPSGMALGGGCEVILACDAVRAHAESYIGLVEVGAGLIPGGGGNKNLLLNIEANLLEKGPMGWAGKSDGGPFPKVQKAFETIGFAKVATSAHEAMNYGYLPRQGRTKVSLSRDRLLWDAKNDVLELAVNYKPSAPRHDILVPGEGGFLAIKSAIKGYCDQNMISAHDALIATKLASVLCAGKLPTQGRVSEQYLLDIEREAFLSLCGEEKTQARMQSLLMTGKPLRN